MRDDRRGRRATIRTNGDMIPRFEPLQRSPGNGDHRRVLFGEKALRSWWRSLLDAIASTPETEETARADRALTPEKQESEGERCGSSQREIDRERPACAAQTGAIESEPTADGGDRPPIHSARIRRSDRIVPITRRRLRQHVPITWPTVLGDEAVTLTGPERLELLRVWSQRRDDARSGEALARAYLEEDLEGRLIALQALVAGRQSEGPSIFRDALRYGTEPERLLAIDGLERCGRHEELLAALHDRVEPIAAKAALAFARTRSRREFVERLERYVSPARIEAMLALLVGLQG